MNVIGIVCEYDPFHNGHKYQIEKIKEKYKDSLNIAIMSSSFTQRGNLSIVNKWNKSKSALLNGIDIVIELPYIYSTQSSDIFAHYALFYLNKLKIDTICFGSESSNKEMLINNAKIQLYNDEFNILVQKYMKEGINYPTALNKSLTQLGGSSINEANDLLALSYIKEILLNNYNIDIYNIKRTNNYHDLSSNDNIISSSNIRNKLQNNEDISKYIPENTNNLITYHNYTNKYFELLKYKINTEEDLEKYLDVDEGLSVRIKKYINISSNLEELIQNIKTKRYTYNKINRMLNHILCSYTKDEKEKFIKPEYIRVLGFSKNGKKYLNKTKKDLDIDILNKYDTTKYKSLNIEKRVSEIYSILYEDIMKDEIKNIPIKITL